MALNLAVIQPAWNIPWSYQNRPLFGKMGNQYAYDASKPNPDP